MSKPFAIREMCPIDVAAVDANPLLDRIFRNRGVASPRELDLRLSELSSPSSLLGIDDATSVILDSIDQGHRILVIGDYDCDGATATTCAVEGLRLLGAKDVRFLVPDRAIHGYGLTPAIVREAGEQAPDLIITVDNGIASLEGAAAVKALPRNTRLVITDHHLPASSGELPCADAIVNPNQPGCQFPSKNLAGCGVIFYVIMALRSKMREIGRFTLETQPSLNGLLDVVALGTVADVVRLDRNNRIIVSAGLKLIRSGRARPGINALMAAGKRDPAKVSSTDLGFTLGPRINAAGRLDDMTLGIQCLLEQDAEAASRAATTLSDLNAQRRAIEAEMAKDAKLSLPALGSAMSVVLYDEEWHEGVVGILSSRVKDQMLRPTICFTATNQLKILISSGASPQEVAEGEVKGSGRSISGFHLKHVLDRIAKEQPDLLTKYGGHSMAAGVGLKQKNLARFIEVFERVACEMITPDMIDGAVAVDIKDIPGEWVTLANASSIAASGPWGQGFNEPKFSAILEPISTKVLKEKHLKMRVRIDSSQEVDAIAFNCIGEDGKLPEMGPLEAVFSLSVNEWNGRRSLQLIVDTFRPALRETTEFSESQQDDIIIEGLSRKSPLARRKLEQAMREAS